MVLIWVRKRVVIKFDESDNVLTEGPWMEVCKAIQDCHKAVHEQGAPRIATDIRIGTRVDRQLAPGTANDAKVARVHEILQKWKDDPSQGS
jgi:uncharacterized protein YqgV (UPF0045/DUF77 family)